MKYLLDNLKCKVVAVTGASGYIGSALVDRLVNSTSELLCVSRQELESKPGTQSIRADLSSIDDWLGIVKKADVIFHLAGNTSVYAAKRNPVENLNSTLLPITHLIRAAKELGRQPRVIFASTATVYGLPEKLPVDEATVANPVTVYDLHKYFAEQQLTLATRMGIIKNISLRLANVYGPSSNVSSSEDRGILNKVSSMAVQGNDLNIYGDGNYLRDYVYIDDVIDAFIHAGSMTKNYEDMFNVSSAVGTTIKHAFELVIDQVERVTGQRVNLNCVPWPPDADAIEHRNFFASNTSITLATGWKARINLAEGINLMISEYLKR